MRWFFTSDEVIARMAGPLRSSRAVIRPLAEHPWFAAEAARALAGLPEWDRCIVHALARLPRALWAPLPRAASPRASPGDLVELPAGTVVLTFKLPGSDLELELKRTGRARPRPLAVVWERAGQPVPYSHRLDGGSTWTMLRWEAAAAARLCEVWRAIHGEEAPVSRTLAVKAVDAVPDGESELPVLDFFVEEAARPDLAKAVEALCAFWGEEPPETPGRAALAARFLRHCSPAQSLVLGTTAHRLDKLAEALGVAPGPAAAGAPARRALADLLDEILGVFTPPTLPCPQTAAWLDAAFAVPANRRRAGNSHRAAAERLGRLWGTFLALGVHSHGESLVGRNVGLKAVFRPGGWGVELIAMDHDNLRIAWRDQLDLDPAAALAANVKDELALFGGPYKGAQVRGSLDLLADLYRAGEAARSAARARFFAAARQAFQRSAAALEPGGAAAELFAMPFRAAVGRWRRAVAGFLAGSPAPAENEAWAAAIEQHGAFLRRQAAVYAGEG